jgi:hypothetical protein
MRYVVTGAAGFIGSHLSRTLLGAGHEVRGIDCFTDYYDPALKEENARGLDIERVDLANEALSFTGFDGVFHLAGQPGPTRSFENFPLYLRRNVEAAQHVFEAAARDGVRVVFASSSSVYGDVARFPTPEDALPVPLSTYGVTKLAAAHLAEARERSAQLDVVVLPTPASSGPAAPDMAFRKSPLAGPVSGLRPLRRRAQTRSWLRGRRGRGDDRRDERERRPQHRRRTESLRDTIAAFEGPPGASMRRQRPWRSGRTSADTTTRVDSAAARHFLRGRRAGAVGMSAETAVSGRRGPAPVWPAPPGIAAARSSRAQRRGRRGPA